MPHVNQAVDRDADDDGGRRIPLNRSERVYLALEGVAGAIAQTHVLRFATAHSADRLRAAVRTLIRTTPRLRAQVEDTWRGTCLRVLPEGPAVDVAFDEVFRTIARDGTDLDGCLAGLINQPFDLQGGLPLRVRVLNGGPTPIVIFNVHHIVCDGRGLVDLIASFLALLGDQTPAPLGLESPSMVPALLPAPRSMLATARSLWSSFRLDRRQRRQRRSAKPITSQHPADFGPVSVVLHDCRVPLSLLKTAAATQGATVTELLIAAFAQAFAGSAQPDGLHAVTARLSLDLRPHFPANLRPRFGNYVASFLVSLLRWNELSHAIGEVRSQMRAALAAFAEHRMSYPLLIAALVPRLISRRVFARAACALRRRGRLEPITFHLSNLGNVDVLNQMTPHAQLASLHFFTPAVGPYVGCIGMGDRLHLAITHDPREMPPSTVTSCLTHLEELLFTAASSPPVQASRGLHNVEPADASWERETRKR